jgi:nucleoside-diphosphate-sugar epimerase
LQFLYAVPTPNETTPTVLVVGATGDIGRQVVRKLILKGRSIRRTVGGLGFSHDWGWDATGYRVQVLVRNLYSSTLNLLGTGM